MEEAAIVVLATISRLYIDGRTRIASEPSQEFEKMADDLQAAEQAAKDEVESITGVPINREIDEDEFGEDELGSGLGFGAPQSVTPEPESVVLASKGRLNRLKHAAKSQVGDAWAGTADIRATAQDSARAQRAAAQFQSTVAHTKGVLDPPNCSRLDHGTRR